LRIFFSARSSKCHSTGAFDYIDIPVPVLRAVKITMNEAARKQNIFIPENMRVPEYSVIYSVYQGESDDAKATEDLSWWQTSDGKTLPKRRVLIKVKRFWDDIYALIIPEPTYT
jgi:hypothetical protein